MAAWSPIIITDRVPDTYDGFSYTAGVETIIYAWRCALHDKRDLG